MRNLVTELNRTVLSRGFLGKASMLALCGALWPLVGLACSAPTLSVHLAYASPFILYYLLVIAAARYFPGAAAALCFGASAARRLSNE